jgi:polar amino acid transport system substrate-binding protein
MKRMLTAAVAAVLLLGLAAGAWADVRQELTRQSTIARAVDRGVLKVGFSTFVPWAMKDKQGEFIGFEVDVARRLAADLGLEVQFVPTKWSGIIPALAA